MSETRERLETLDRYLAEVARQKAVLEEAAETLENLRERLTGCLDQRRQSWDRRTRRPLKSRVMRRSVVKAREAV